MGGALERYTLCRGSLPARLKMVCVPRESGQVRKQRGPPANRRVFALIFEAFIVFLGLYLDTRNPGECWDKRTTMLDSRHVGWYAGRL